MVNIGGQMKPVVVLRLSAILLQPVHRGRRPRRLRKPRASLVSSRGGGGAVEVVGGVVEGERREGLGTLVTALSERSTYIRNWRKWAYSVRYRGADGWYMGTYCAIYWKVGGI